MPKLTPEPTWRLMPKEIDGALKPYWVKSVACKTCGNVRNGIFVLSVSERDGVVADAQAKKIAGWLEGDCPHRTMVDELGKPDISLRKRYECWECRQELLEGGK